MINDASVVIGGGNWGIKEADVLGYKLINDEYYARDIDFANSTAAGTYTDSTGVVRKAPYNLLQQSNTFSTTWATALATVTIGQTGYDGTNNAWLLEKSNTDGRIGQSITLTSGAYTYSVYAKAGTKNWVFLRVDGTSNRTAYFDLQTGVTGTATGCTSSISPVGNGWYRCSITFTDSMTIARIYVADANNDTSGTSGNILIQAAQLVEGTEALPYFPTTTRLNVPRIDYRNADGSLSTTGRLLLEPQRTNVYIGSEQLIDLIGVTGVSNNATAPDGNNSADTITEDTSLGRHFTGCPTMNVGSTTVSASAFLKYVDNQYAQLCVLPAGSISFSAIFDLVNGTITATRAEGTATYLSGKIENYGNGWYRCSITGISTQASNFFNIGLSPTATFGTLQFQMQSYTGTGKSMRIWGKQLEAGAYPTTYIPTTTAAVTRNADAASRTGVSSWIGQTEGTLFAEVDIKNVVATTRGILEIRTTGTQTIALICFSNGNLGGYIINGTDQFVRSITTVAGRYKMALAYSAASTVLYINGQIVGSASTSVSVPASSAVQLGIYGISNYLGDSITQAAIFPTRLTNEQLAQLTTL